MRVEEFRRLGIADIVTLTMAREVSVEEITEASIRHSRRVNNVTGCFVALEDQRALDTARALDATFTDRAPLPPLFGVPLAHKDMYARAGMHCGAGSPLLEEQRSDITATAISRLDAAGCINLGRLQSAEFTVSPTGYNVHYGPVRNPWNINRVPGGSSSGSAAAVSAGAIPGSLGSDAGGSIRHPAAMCGITGLKPTLGRISRHGLFPLASSLDHTAILARSAEDAALLLKVLAGRDPGDPSSSDIAIEDYPGSLSGDIGGLRIGIPTSYYFDELAPDIAGALATALNVFGELGAENREVQVVDMEEIGRLGRTVFVFEAFAAHNRWIGERSDAISPLVRARIEAGRDMLQTDYQQALDSRPMILNTFLDTSMAEVDVLFTPCVPVHTPSIESAEKASVEESLELGNRITRCTRALNYLTLPAISVPCGFAYDGMPVAFQMIARPFRESLLLRAADAYQRATTWHREVPPLTPA